MVPPRRAAGVEDLPDIPGSMPCTEAPEAPSLPTAARIATTLLRTSDDAGRSEVKATMLGTAGIDGACTGDDAGRVSRWT